MDRLLVRSGGQEWRALAYSPSRGEGRQGRSLATSAIERIPLAGYAKRKDETLAFVILCNNETRKADSSVLIDALATLLINN